MNKLLKIHPVVGSRKMLTCMELIFVFICYAALISTSFVIYHDYIERSRVTEAIELSTLIRHQYVIQFNQTGEWEKPVSFFKNKINLKDYQYVTGIDYQDKSYTFKLKLNDGKDYILSFRIAEGFRINWLCGYQIPLVGHVPSTQNETNLPVEYLPIACRGKYND